MTQDHFTNGKPLDTSLVGDYLDTVAGLGLSEYVSYNVTEEELEAFGLVEPELTITVDFVEAVNGIVLK